MSKSNPQNPQGKLQSNARLNFLYQSANLMLSESSGKKKSKNLEKVSNYYSQLMITIGHKSVQRLSKDLKRTICKGCRGVLIPGKTAKIIKKKTKFGTLCLMCKNQKLFPIEKKASKTEKKS